jgi:hypothetical protein
MGYLRNVIGNAFVDFDLLPYIMKFKWFLSDPRKPKTPKTQMRINGVPKTILLNRLVFTLEPLDSEQKDLLTDRVNIATLYKLVEAQPKLKYRRNDPFDCRFINLEVMTRGVEPSLQDDHEELEHVNWRQEKRAISEDEQKNLKEMLEKRADDLKRKKDEDERRKHEVPDDYDALSEDPQNILGLANSKERIEQAKQEQEDLLKKLGFM